nr:lysylphosphatidylglycerol synthase transmembrane domain-containing protein [Synergistales bacterium]
MEQNGKIILSFLLGILVSGIAIYISFRNVPLAQLMVFVKNIHFWWIVPSVLLALSTYLVRGLRWKIILNPIRKISFWHAFHPVVIAFTINCLLPGRLGELARPAILYKRDRLEFSKVLATVGVERIFDIATLLLIFIVIMGGIRIDPSLTLTFNGYRINQMSLMQIKAKLILAGLLLLALIFMLMFPVTRKWISRSIAFLPRLLFFTTPHFRQHMSERALARSHAILDNLAVGLQVLRNPTRVLVCFLLSAGVWILTFGSFYILALGCPSLDITFAQASAAVIIICFFIMLPSVPGYWGIWEVGGIYGLMIFGIPKIEAAGLTLTYHFFQVIPLVMVGLVSSWL